MPTNDQQLYLVRRAPREGVPDNYSSGYGGNAVPKLYQLRSARAVAGKNNYANVIPVRLVIGEEPVNQDTAMINWLLPFITGGISTDADIRTLALGQALMNGFDGREAIAQAMKLYEGNQKNID